MNGALTRYSVWAIFKVGKVCRVRVKSLQRQEISSRINRGVGEDSVKRQKVWSKSEFLLEFIQPSIKRPGQSRNFVGVHSFLSYIKQSTHDFHLHCTWSLLSPQGRQILAQVAILQTRGYQDQIAVTESWDVAAAVNRETNIEAVTAGNVTSRRSRNVIRVARTEVLAEGDYHKDPVKLLQLLLERKQNLIAHIDATGSLVNEIPDLQGSSSRLSDIQICLDWLCKKSLAELDKHFGRLFSRIETDFSFALISAVLASFSVPSMNGREYLNLSFDELSNCTVPAIVNFHVCRSHMAKTLVETIKRKYKPVTTTKEVLKSLLQK
ncbi:unnamed protein product [Allacma fusca]|uniref:Uncharacterized protein n=1 Tax=Allacma fusca TaxID=39272 RepID=A0A8J2JD12_9HEXA|nr:unnamed protein product [Allacma fusca]